MKGEGRVKFATNKFSTRRMCLTQTHSKIVWTAALVSLVFFSVVSMTGRTEAAALSISKTEISTMTSAISSVTGWRFKSTPKVTVLDIYDLKKKYDEDDVQYQKIYLEKGIEGSVLKGRHYSLLGEYSLAQKRIYLGGEVIRSYAVLLNLDADIVKKIVTVHEMVHALADQQYAAGELILHSPNQEKVLLALAVFEGHAYVTAAKALSKLGVRQADLDKFLNLVDKSQPYWPLYAKGIDFVNYQLKNTKLSIKDIFQQLPASAAILLNPQRYVANKYVPARDLKSVLGNSVLNLPWYFAHSACYESSPLDMLLNREVLSMTDTALQAIKSRTTLNFREVLDQKPVGNYHLEYLGQAHSQELVINIYQLEKPEDVNTVEKCCRNVIEKLSKSLKFQTTEVDFAYIKSRFSRVYVKKLYQPQVGEQFYCLALLKPGFFLEIKAVHMQIYEEEIFQLLNQLKKWI